MKRFILILFLMLAAFGFTAYGAQSEWVATPSATVVGTSGTVGAGTVVSVTASTTQVVNLFSSLPNNDFQFVILKVSAGTGYLGTTSSGAPFTSTHGPIVVPLPFLAKSRGYLPFLASDTGTVVKMIPYKVQDQ